MKNKIIKSKVIGIVAIAILLSAAAYFFIPSLVSSDKIPDYITGDRRMMYEWSKIDPGKSLLKQIPCYCGCKYDGHANAYNCFWTDEGRLDKHSSTCSVCLDIAMKTKKMHDEGKNICEIRKAIDEFYEPNKDLATDTPMPEGC